MKTISKLTVILMLSFGVLMQTGCLGEFSLTKAVYEFNQDVSDDKYVNNLVFWAACVVPVYEVALIVDCFFLNLMEFWTGDNPLALKDGETQIQYAQHKGETYKMVATNKSFTSTKISTGQQMEMVYTEQNKTWNLKHEGELIKLAGVDMNNENNVEIYLPNQEPFSMNMNGANLARLNTYCTNDLASN